MAPIYERGREISAERIIIHDHNGIVEPLSSDRKIRLGTRLSKFQWNDSVAGWITAITIQLRKDENYDILKLSVKNTPEQVLGPFHATVVRNRPVARDETFARVKENNRQGGGNITSPGQELSCTPDYTAGKPSLPSSVVGYGALMTPEASDRRSPASRRARSDQICSNSATTPGMKAQRRLNVSEASPSDRGKDLDREPEVFRAKIGYEKATFYYYGTREKCW